MVFSSFFYGRNLVDNCFRIYVLLCLYTPLLGDFIKASSVQLIDDAFFLVLLVFCIIPLFRSISKIDKVVFILPLFVIISCLISFFNGNDVSIIVLSIKNNKNLFLFLVLICLSENHSQFIKKQIVFMLAASVPVAIYQFFTVLDQDDITGLFGPKSTSLYSLIAITFISVEIVKRKINSKAIVGWYFVLFVPVFLNETKISFVIMPIILIYLLLVIGELKFKDIALLFFTFFGMLSLLNELYFNLYGYEFSEMFTYDFLELYFLDYTDLHNDIPRLYRLIFAYDYISSSDLFEYLFGYGIGSVYVGGSGYKLGLVSSVLEYTNFNSGSRIQLFQMLIDYGVIGSALFVSVFTYFLAVISFKIKSCNDLYSICFVIIMIICLVYQNMLYTKQLSFIFYYYTYVSLIKFKPEMLVVKKRLKFKF